LVDQTVATPKLSLFPQTAGVNGPGHLTLGGCDAAALAAKHGTPLYVFDETTIRKKCAEYRTEFSQRYPNTLVIYACKAFVNPTLAILLHEEGLGLDVVSAGEISIARSVAFPSDKVYFHGNNKSRGELALALEWGIGRVVVDNFHELHLLAALAAEKGVVQDILLRISPGVDPHTHKYITTGVLDSKFGFPLATGQAEEALARAIATPSLNVVGLHFHLGSSIFEAAPYVEAIEQTLRFAIRMKEEHGFKLTELNVGGGFAVQYQLHPPPPPTSEYAEVITSALLRLVHQLALDPPQLIIEPGRAIIAQAGVALYRVGATKDIPSIRKYVFVDGGMGDNIRPALYGSQYEAVVANKVNEAETDLVTIAGKFCESGDILIKDIRLPVVREDDIIAIPTSGAYSLPMASNYNASLRPAILMVTEGQSRLIRRRETHQDLTRCDLS
jgi:diaminopimelate decarboxylase